MERDRTIVFSPRESGASIVVLRYELDYITAQLDLDPVFRLINRAGMQSLLLSLALGVLVSAMVGHRMLRPVRELNAATQKVAAGDFTLQIPNANPCDEIGTLINNFNIMTRELSSV